MFNMISFFHASYVFLGMKPFIILGGVVIEK